MPPCDLNDAKYWRGQAAELRAKADTYKNEFAAHAVRRIADNYDQMAERAKVLASWIDGNAATGESQ
jgi:hypothetical protein